MKFISAVVLFAGLVACQQEPARPVSPPQQPVTQQPDKQDPEAEAAKKVLAEVMAQFEKEGIKLDGKAQTLTIKAVVNDPPDPIEYLLVHRRGKRHEAMFWTPSKASVLNAAMLMLGLEQGKNANYVEKDPPPTLEEIEKGVDPLIVTPPQGKPFWMTVRWKDAQGKTKEYCVEDLLLDRTTGKPATDCSWVYLGGRMAQLYKNEPEVFVADFEGNFVSVCYLSPDNHLGTMVHERARDDQNWWITDLLPPPETAVEVVFHKQEPQLHVERRKRLAAAKAKEGEAKEGKDKEAGK
ncbi:MAG: hypothetical protein H6838_11275 [Planctomycetes bacterium]|nr:hypothetical protein [Planctomycetota bacterium]MCB9886067.1 hypothetical protein [Planctomycetota bacterium]